MKMPELEHFKITEDWKPMTKATCEQMGWSPNWVYYNAKTSQAQIRIKRASHGDFALSASALTYHIQAEDEGRIKAYVVLVERDQDQTLVARTTAKTVRQNVNGFDPLPSSRDYSSPYYWLDEHFEVKDPNQLELPY